MNKEDELNMELLKNEADKVIVKQELETEKNKFIEALESGMGDEMRNFNRMENAPVKLRKPLKNKITEFFIKLGKVLWN